MTVIEDGVLDNSVPVGVSFAWHRRLDLPSLVVLVENLVRGYPVLDGAVNGIIDSTGYELFNVFSWCDEFFAAFRLFLREVEGVMVPVQPLPFRQLFPLCPVVNNVVGAVILVGWFF